MKRKGYIELGGGYARIGGVSLHYPCSARRLRRAGYSSPLPGTVVNTVKLTHYR